MLLRIVYHGGIASLGQFSELIPHPSYVSLVTDLSQKPRGECGFVS